MAKKSGTERPFWECTACGFTAADAGEREEHLEKMKDDAAHREAGLGEGPPPDDTEDRYVEEK